MPIKLQDVPEKAFSIVQKTLAERARAAAFTLPALREVKSLSGLSIALPHRVQVIGSELIKHSGGRLERERDVATWRFLLMRRDGGHGLSALAAATAVRTPSNGFKFGGLNEGPFVSGTAQAVRDAETRLNEHDDEFEPVLLVVPALYVVALWLQRRSIYPAGAPVEADELIVLPPSNPMFEPWVPMDAGRFLKALREVA